MSPYTPEALQAEIPRIFAPWIAALPLTVHHIETGRVRLRLDVRPEFIHVGGVMCGQTAMAAADTAMVLAMMSQLGEFKPMTTVQLQTSFMRPIQGSHCLVEARVLRCGRSLAFGQIDILDDQERLCVQATTTYALL